MLVLGSSDRVVDVLDEAPVADLLDLLARRPHVVVEELDLVEAAEGVQVVEALEVAEGAEPAAVGLQPRAVLEVSGAALWLVDTAPHRLGRLLDENVDGLEAEGLGEPGEAVRAPRDRLALAALGLEGEVLRAGPEQLDVLDDLEPSTDAAREATLFAERGEGKGVGAVEDVAAPFMPQVADAQNGEELVRIRRVLDACALPGIADEEPAEERGLSVPIEGYVAHFSWPLVLVKA